MSKNFLTISLSLLLLLLVSCDSARKREVSFSYRSIMYQEFKSSEGKIIPVTVEQSIETDGDISGNGEYFFYSSDRDNGNFDIYIREMDNVSVARLTSHPSRDTSPAISPDGKRLAFVSNREDPEGDIYLLDIDSGEIIEKAKEKEALSRGIDQDAKNISQYQDPKTGTIMIIRDASPAWSPDGKHIVFSSKRGGSENLFIMNADGKNIKQLTRKGGVYPRYSPDGKKIVFISYRDNASQGEIYIKNLLSGRERKVSKNGAIKLYPEFLGTGSKISYTCIEKDTNGDGRVTLRDRSALRYLHLGTGDSYLLTRQSRNSFKGIWVPGFKTRLYQGVLLYSDQIGENINLNLIPDNGIIPRKRSASAQLDHAERYRTEFNDYEKYIMSLRRVYYFFGRKRDQQSRIFTARALKQLFLEFLKSGRKKEAQQVLKTFSGLRSAGTPYLNTQFNFCRERMRNRSGLTVLLAAKNAAAKSKKEEALIPFLMEDIADSHAAAGNRREALKQYQRILTYHKKYKRTTPVHLKYALLFENRIRNRFSDSVNFIFTRGLSSQKMTLSKHLLASFRRDSRPAQRKQKLLNLLASYPEMKAIKVIIEYGITEAEMQLKQYKKAEVRGEKALAGVRKTDVMYFYLNSLLGEIARKQDNFEKTEIHLYNAALRYLLIWREDKVRDHISWLINYYEDYGERALLENKTVKAEKLFKRYATLMTFLHRKKRFEDYYNQYGARSHVLYIDTYSRRHGRGGHEKLIKQYTSKLAKARMDFDKAHIYGLGYIHTLHAISRLRDDSATYNERIKLKNFLESLQSALGQIDWASFIDDTYIDPYVLKSWIYQYVDLLRQKSGDSEKRLISKYFPLYLFEKNLPILERALSANDEKRFPVHEAKIHLNMGNNYFLLVNYPEALVHYRKAQKLGLTFKTLIEEAIFHFHLGYVHWQTGDIRSGRKEIRKALFIYQSLGAGKGSGAYKQQLLTLYKYFALFNRMEGKYGEAITWYNKIIAFSARSKINIDRARYLQEIAQCHYNLGNDAKAISLINRANILLKSYSRHEKTYKMKFQLFGFIPFYLIDLGEGAIIGETKIYQQLSTFNKQMLSLAMLESIYAKRGNYSKATQYLKKKIDYLKKRESETDRNSLITTYNNLGYYSFKQNRSNDAEKYFRLAWKLASDPDNLNLEATFISIMNLANLYASLLETGSESLKNPFDTINKLIVKIVKFRNEYEEEKFKSGEKKLQKLAKTQNREVTPAELADLKRSISEEANAIYFKIDIALGVLTYYRAELMRASLSNPGGSTAGAAYGLYKGQRDVFSGYHQALVRFQNALGTIENDAQAELKIKLLLNQGTCLTRIQAMDRAYGAFIDAKNLAEKYRLQNLLFSAYSTIGSFLMNHGKAVEGADYALASMEYLQKAAGLIEGNPFAFSGNREAIFRLYENMTALLLRQKRISSAYSVQRRRNILNRNLLIFQASPDFSKKEDRDIYQNYIKTSLESSQQAGKLSSLLLKGLALDSEEVKEAVKAGKKYSSLLKGLRIKMKSSNPGVFRFISATPEKLRIPGNTTIITFLKSNGSPAACVIDSSGVRLEMFTPDKNGSMIEPINSFFNRFSKNENIFITVNNAFVSFIARKEIKAPSFVLITDPSDLNLHLKKIRSDLTTVYYTDRGLKSSAADLPFTIYEEKKASLPVHAYSIIITTSKSTEFKGRNLFSQSLRPVLLVQATDQFNADSMILNLEAARYAGAATVLFTNGKDTPFFKELLSSIRTRSFSSLSAGISEGTLSMAGGHPGTSPTGKKIEGETAKKPEYSAFTRKLKLQKFNEAAVALEEWKNSLADISAKDNTRYYLDSALLLQLQNRGNQAINLLNEVKAGGGNIEVNSIDFFQSYLNAEEGNFDPLKAMVSATSVENSPELDLLKYILAVSEGIKPERIPDSASKPGTMNTSFLRGRLHFLASRILYLSGYRKEAQRILQIEKNETPFSPVERRILPYLSGDKDKSLKSASGIENLMNIESFSEDNVSHWTLKTVEYIFSAKQLQKYGEYESAGKYLEKVSLLYQKRTIPAPEAYLSHLLSISFAAEKKYRKAFETAIPAEKILPSAHTSFLKNQLVLLTCEAFSTEENAAKVRLQKMLKYKNYAPGELFQLYLLSAYTELKVLAKKKKASVSDAIKFERAYYSALKVADLNPSINYSKPVMRLFAMVSEAHIDFKLNTGKKTEALISAEMKRHLLLKMKLQPAGKISGQPGELRAELNRKNISVKGVIEKIKNDPGLILSVNIPTVFINTLQKKLPEKSMLIYFLRNKNDIYCWIITPERKRIIRIPGSFEKLQRTVEGYGKSLRRLSNTYTASVSLENIFSPLKKYFRKTSRVYIITDEHLNNVPFEIIGSNRQLEETHSLVYLTSLAAALRDMPVSFSGFASSRFPGDQAIARLENIAMKESGAVFTNQPVSGAFYHNFLPFSFNPYTKILESEGLPLFENIGGSAGIYFPRITLSEISAPEIALKGIEKGLSYVIVNDNSVHDINNALFVEKFYKLLGKGLSPIDSFHQAKKSIQNNRKLKHPAYWQALRMYCNGM